MSHRIIIGSTFVIGTDGAISVITPTAQSSDVQGSLASIEIHISYGPDHNQSDREILAHVDQFLLMLKQIERVVEKHAPKVQPKTE